MTDRQQPDRLAEAVRSLAERATSSRNDVEEIDDTPARLSALEREVGEMRTRVNALFFAVIAAGVSDLVTRTVLR